MRNIGIKLRRSRRQAYNTEPKSDVENLKTFFKIFVVMAKLLDGLLHFKLPCFSGKHVRRKSRLTNWPLPAHHNSYFLVVNFHNADLLAMGVLLVLQRCIKIRFERTSSRKVSGF